MARRSAKEKSDIERCKFIIGEMLRQIEMCLKLSDSGAEAVPEWMLGSRRSLIDAVEILCGLLIKLNDFRDNSEERCGNKDAISKSDLALVQYYLKRQQAGEHEG